MAYYKRVKVFSEDLAPGMFVSELDRNWEETTFLMQGFKIQGPYDIEEIQRQCKYAYVDFESEEHYKQYKLATSKSTSYRQALKKQIDQSENSYQFNIKPALTRRKKTRSLLKSIFDNIALGQDFDVNALHETVKENVKEVLNNEEAMLMLSMLSQSNEDIADHCLVVSIFAISFAKFLGFSRTEMEDLGMAALLHDIGHIKVDNKILNKYGRLNANERKEVERHPKNGFDIISSKSGLTPSCIDVVYGHHERIDGSGYPRGLQAHSLTKNTKIVSIVDVYESTTKQQSYRKGSPIVRTYQSMLKEKDRLYDGKILMQFIKWRGIYPPGSIVEFDDGRVGIVIARSKRSQMMPLVLQVLDEYKQKIKEKVLNPDKEDCDFKILNAYENNAFGIFINDYLEKGLQIKV